MQVMKTKNYDMFVVSKHNRTVKGLESLMKSMSIHGFIPAYPLHCARLPEGKLMVKAGHHRLTAAITLETEVYYVVTDDSSTILELENASRAWTNRDYIESHSKIGPSAARTVLEFSQRTGISIGQSIALHEGRSARSSAVKDEAKMGSIGVNGKSHAEDIANIVGQLKMNGIKHASTAHVVAAISSVLKANGVDSKMFKKQLSRYYYLLTRQATTDQYLVKMEEIYNYRLNEKSKVCVAFLAKQKTQA